MGAEQDPLFYPRGRVAMGAGDLNDAYDIAIARAKGVKQESTLRMDPAGTSRGPKTGSITFKSKISETGFERDYDGPYERHENVQVRVKIPGKTYVCVGQLDDLNVTSNVDGAIDFSCKIVGSINTTNV